MPCKKPYILKLKQPLDDWKVEILGYQPKFIAVPCGKCADCLGKKARDLFVRAYSEVRMRPASYFVTLTYSDEYLPLNNKSLKPTLSLKDFQGFLKRMRKNNDFNIMYVGCGEYGDKGKRPHYHFILMFYPFCSPEECYNMVERAWFRGCRIQVAPAEPATIHYVLKYLIKEQNFNEIHTSQGGSGGCGNEPPPGEPIKEFAKWSKYLGISLITPEFAHYIWQHGSFDVHYNGIKYGLPSYLRLKLFESGYLTHSQMLQLLKDNFNLMWDFDNDTLRKYKKKFGDRIGLDYYRMSADVKELININRKKNKSSL